MMQTASQNRIDANNLSLQIDSDRQSLAIRWTLMGCGAFVIALEAAFMLQASHEHSFPKGASTILSRPASLTSSSADQASPAAELPLEITSQSTRMRLALIPAGTFEMGSLSSEAERGSDEGPRHQIQIAKPFYLGVHEVTQNEYQAIMARNPSQFSHVVTIDETVVVHEAGRFPVESISWFDAIEFCNRLSERDGRPAYYRLTNVSRQDGSIETASVTVLGGTGYRLPTEAEWEYACRANTTSPFEFGSTLNGLQANVDGGSPYGTSETGPNLQRTTSVGSYAGNGFGLFDMHGNVAEWCEDIYDAQAYATKSGSTHDSLPSTDETSHRVARGGSWASGGDKARAAHRYMYFAGNPEPTVGLRVACSAAITTPTRANEHVPAFVASSQE